LPLFGDIVFGVDQCLFVVQKYRTECFLSHYHAYEVSKDSSYSVYTASDFADYHPLCMYVLSNNKKVIPLKYHIIEKF
jgi:hypothetical protein